MTDAEADGVGSGKVPSARVSLLFTVRCTGTTGLWIDFGFVSDGRESAGLSLSIMRKPG